MSERVLLVDDDERLVNALRMRLAAAGYEVFTAGDGEAGLSMAATLRPDAIILDMRMPRVDGFEVCRIIREVVDIRDIPIIVLSASATSREIQDAGGNTFIRKPYQLPHLLSVLKQEMARPSAGANPSTPGVP